MLDDPSETMRARATICFQLAAMTKIEGLAAALRRRGQVFHALAALAEQELWEMYDGPVH